MPNRYWTAWRHRVTEPGFFGVCAFGWEVDQVTGAFTFVGGVSDIDVDHDFLRSPGGLVIQARGDEVTIVNSNTGFAADVGCDGSFTNKWSSITSLDHGQTWPRKATVGQSNIRTCLPDAVNGAIETGIRNFAFVRDAGGTMRVAVPNDDNLGFKLFASTDVGTTWQFDVVVAGSMQTVFPTLSVDDKGRIGLSFQALGLQGGGQFGVSTWFAAVPAGFVSFVGPVPISPGFNANNPPPQGSCSHSLCSTGAGLSPGCDPTGCVNAVLAKNGACALNWTRGCADLVAGNCGGFTCSTRFLGDYNGAATVIPSGDIPGGQRDLLARLDSKHFRPKGHGRARSGLAMTFTRLAFSLACAVAACGGTLVGGPDGAGGDVAPAVCRPTPNPFRSPSSKVACTSDDSKKCQDWAQSLTASGFAHASCVVNNGTPACIMGVSCSVGQSGLTDCVCGDGQCSTSQVCVSDTQSGRSTCRPVCLPNCLQGKKDGCTAPGEACWCSGVPDVCGSNEVCTFGAPNVPPPSCQPQCVDGG